MCKGIMRGGRHSASTIITQKEKLSIIFVALRSVHGRNMTGAQAYLQVMPNVGLGEGYGQISHAGLAL